MSALRAYLRVVARLDNVSEALSELKFLQERRYGQVSGRLDYTNDYLRLLKKLIGRSGDGRSSRSVDSSNDIARFDELVARIQRAERRVLGRIEDETYKNHWRSERLDQKISELK